MTNLIKAATIEDLQRWGDDASIMELGRRALDKRLVTDSELQYLIDDAQQDSFDAGHDDGYDEGVESGYDEGHTVGYREGHSDGLDEAEEGTE